MFFDTRKLLELRGHYKEKAMSMYLEDTVRRLEVKVRDLEYQIAYQGRELQRARLRDPDVQCKLITRCGCETIKMMPASSRGRIICIPLRIDPKITYGRPPCSVDCVRHSVREFEECPYEEWRDRDGTITHTYRERE